MPIAKNDKYKQINIIYNAGLKNKASPTMYIELCNYCCKSVSNIPAIAGFRPGVIEVLEKDRAPVHTTTKGRLTNDAEDAEVKLGNGGEATVEQRAGSARQCLGWQRGQDPARFYGSLGMVYQNAPGSGSGKESGWIFGHRRGTDNMVFPHRG
jgi:hypothetical protein